VLTLTTGAGVHQFTLDPDIGEFLLTRTHIQIAADATEFAINMSRQRHWTAPVDRYVRECLQGTEGPRGADFNMRWIASLVAEVHRILARGGVFTYPLDARLMQSGKAGRLRLLYELLPMAFIVEQAGGGASTGTRRLLSVTPDDLHARAPVFLGARNEIERIERYHHEATTH
jgi:fructose-1,6-bisphosphatase I